MPHGHTIAIGMGFGTGTFDDHFGLLTQIASEKISNALLLVLLHIVSLLLHIFVNVTHSLQSFLV